jgi:3-oxoacyl-[acyl-carrier protein] reductase
MTSQNLAASVALVTGGSRGIGAAIVRRLAREGATVVFTYTNSAALAETIVSEIEADGGAAFSIAADSADEEAVKAAVGETVRRFGRLDILVNNAGILIRGPVDAFELADFDRMLAVNVRAVFVAVQAAVPHMSEGGRIITTGSVSAERAGGAGAAVYAMTKAAVAGLTRGFARDLGPRGITVNVIQPGPTETDITNDATMRAALTPQIAIGRLGKDSEIASLVAYIASPQASFVNGSALTIDGGFLA